MAAAASSEGQEGGGGSGTGGGLFLEWKFGGAEGRVALPVGREVVLGRGAPAAVQDTRTSRRQVAVTAAADGVVRVRALGLNPALVAPDTFLVRQDAAPAVLPVGGTLCLLCDGTYPFVLRRDAPAPAPKPKPTPAPAPAPRWQWRADDGWCDYAAAVAARLEDARRRGVARVDIDRERFVDVPALLQRRKDDPSKRREVRRVAPSVSAAAAAAAAAAAGAGANAAAPSHKSTNSSSTPLDG